MATGWTSVEIMNRYYEQVEEIAEKNELVPEDVFEVFMDDCWEEWFKEHRYGYLNT